MSENSGQKDNPVINSHNTDKSGEPEIRILTQEFCEQIKSFKAPLRRQLKDLTWLVQGLSVTLHPNQRTRANIPMLVVMRRDTRPTWGKTIGEKKKTHGDLKRIKNNTNKSTCKS